VKDAAIPVCLCEDHVSDVDRACSVRDQGYRHSLLNGRIHAPAGGADQKSSVAPREMLDNLREIAGAQRYRPLRRPRLRADAHLEFRRGRSKSHSPAK
jgi:hypothetical protein